MKNIGGTFINYTYARNGIDNWLSCFPSNFNSKAEGHDSIYIGQPFKVTSEIQEVEAGLSYRLTEQILEEDQDYTTEPCDSFNLIIYFYQFEYNGKMSFQIGKTAIENEGPAYRAIIMTNTTVQQKLSLQKGTLVKGLAIMISEDWIRQNLRNIDSGKYEQLTSNELILDYLTAKHQKILLDLFEGIREAHLPALYATSRVMRLLGNFFETLFTREVAEIKEAITPKDFQSVLKIESLLLQSYDEGFPKIENLARLALMSESKLKKLYKRAFGMGLYEYYQKNRMHKAKELLHTGKYSVSQVGSMLGYQNLSNFSASFKKEFNSTPSDFMHVG